MSFAPEALVNQIRGMLPSLADPGYAASLPRTMPGLQAYDGVRVPELRRLAADLRREHRMTVPDWVYYLTFVFPSHHRELILIGLYGLDGRTGDLDDLFGERMGGWARHLDNWETTDNLAISAGNWVAADLSRTGYLEAWAVRGETVWKKRLAAASTVYLGRHATENTHSCLRVLRHLMTAPEAELKKAVAWALREQKDQVAVERFLAWWAPRVSRGLITDASKGLPAAGRQRLKELLDRDSVSS